MSLLQNQTTSLLGIGTGSVQDFAAGVRTRRKYANRPSQEERDLTIRRRGSGHGKRVRAVPLPTDPEDPRIPKLGTEGAPNPEDVSSGADNQGGPELEPQKIAPERFGLTEDDRAFIQQVQDLKLRYDTVMSDPPGKSATKRMRSQFKDFLDLAANSSREGLADIWAPVIEAFSPRIGSQMTSMGEMKDFHRKFKAAYEATNPLLDTRVNLGTYQFAPGREERLTYEAKNPLAIQQKTRTFSATSKAAYSHMPANSYWRSDS